ncbi:hypothetical protein [Streptomyces sp. NPDC096339]|uniref:hypothetical protein n=1 Tax=Streptomyces sp. NPDC096339 TaxID=3366086 RepID=UPI00380489C3
MNSALPPLVPNAAAIDRRAIVSGTDTAGLVPVEYKFRPADGDARHLIVVFSGLGAPKGYHFAGKSLESQRANILWIRDHFDEHYSYYMCRNMSFDIEFSVLSLIDRTLAGLNLTRGDVSLFGVSKGGSAALYYGLKYGFRNIVSVVPQFLIGDYVSDPRRATTGRYMLGADMPQQNVDALNHAIPDMLKSYGAQGHNVYLITSEADEQYPVEIAPHLNLFWNCQNFNVIRTKSDMVRAHGEVSGYNMPLMNGILSALTEGAEPRLGFLENGFTPDPGTRRHVMLERRHADTLLAVLKKQDIRANYLQLSGDAFIPGESAYGEVQTLKHLVVEGGGKSWEFPLAVTPAEHTYSFYFDQYASDYADGGFAPEHPNGIAMTGIPSGRFDLSIRLTSPSEGIDRRTPLVAKRPFDLRRPFRGTEICLTGDDKSVKLLRRPIIGHVSPETAFSLEKTWQKGRVLHVEGVFFVHGLSAAQHSHASYYLVLRNAQGTYSYRLGMSGKPAVVRKHVRRGDYNSYDYGYFATSGYKGIEAKTAEPGDYEVFISMSREGALFSAPAGTVRLD